MVATDGDLEPRWATARGRSRQKRYTFFLGHPGLHQPACVRRTRLHAPCSMGTIHATMHQVRWDMAYGIVEAGAKKLPTATLNDKGIPGIYTCHTSHVQLYVHAHVHAHAHAPIYRYPCPYTYTCLTPASCDALPGLRELARERTPCAFWPMLLSVEPGQWT